MVQDVLVEGYGLNEVPARPEIASEAVKPRFGKRFVIGLVALSIIVVASAIMFIQFLPGVRGDAVTLGLDYSVGEEMTYEIDMIIEMMGFEVSQEATLKMEVQSFDGENYTIRQTMMVELEESSFEMKMNKTGHIVEYLGLPPEFDQTFSSFFGVPGFGSYFTEEEVKVGESWETPFDVEVPGVDFEGTICYELSEITSVTVPAGSYEALKINIAGSDLHMGGMDFSANWSINGDIYLEKDTCRLIDVRFDQAITTTAMNQTVSMEMTIQMQLTEHLK